MLLPTRHIRCLRGAVSRSGARRRKNEAMALGRGEVAAGPRRFMGAWARVVVAYSSNG